MEGAAIAFVDADTEHDGRWITTYRQPQVRGWLGSIHRRNAHWGVPHLLEPMLARIARRPLRIVDLGCGGGWGFLTKFGYVTGIDHGRRALQAATAVYDRALRAQVDRLPLADGSVDVAVSIWMFEHLPERQFVATLREIRRVLRPHGRLVFFADLDSSKPILRWAKGFPEDYARHHIDKIGHHGLRSLEATKELLAREGFVETATIAVSKSSVLQPVTALWMFDNELGRRSRALSRYVDGCRGLVRSRWHRPVYVALMEYHRLVDRWLPDSYAFSAAFDWHPESAGAGAARDVDG